VERDVIYARHVIYAGPVIYARHVTYAGHVIYAQQPHPWMTSPMTKTSSMRIAQLIRDSVLHFA
jgi:hypothetical protein